MMHQPIIVSALAGWCVLRTSAPRTLSVAASLAEAGFDVWTPRLIIKRRRPRSKATIEIAAPIMPTFVFVRAHQMAELRAVLTLPINPHPPFSIFHHAGRIPVLGDGQMLSLRAEEDREARRHRAEKEKAERSALRASAPVPPIGTEVRIGEAYEGAFAGMTGIVAAERGRAAVIDFGGRINLTVDAYLLETITAVEAVAA